MLQYLLVVLDSINDLPSKTFFKCNNLKSLTLSKTLNHIHPTAFSGVDLKGLKVTCGDNEFIKAWVKLITSKMG